MNVFKIQIYLLISEDIPTHFDLEFTWIFIFVKLKDNKIKILDDLQFLVTWESSALSNAH